MAKKKLLNESQVRRFMGLAGLGALSENMSSSMYEEDKMNEAGAMYEEDEDMDMEDDKDMDMDMEAEGTVELEQDDVEVLADLAEKLPSIVAKLQGDDMDMEAGDDMDMEAGDDMDMGGDDAGEEDADMPMDMGDEDEEAEGDAEEVISEALKGVNLQLSNKEIVNEVARRVAKRILKAKAAQKNLDEALGNRRTRRPIRRSKK